MNFGEAMKMMRMDVPMTRLKWEDNKREVRIKDKIFTRSEDIEAGHHDRVVLSYNPTVKDLLATDWEVIR